MSYFRDQLEEWLKQIPVKAEKVLDVGGAANPVSRRVASWEVDKYRIIDNLAEAPKELQWGLGVENGLYQQKDINVPWHVPMTNDIVFCLELFEYVWDPVTALKNIASVTKDGGILYISFPFVYPMHKPLGIDYLRYTEEGARKLLDVAGFDVAELRARVARNPQFLRAFYSSDGMHSRRDDTEAHTGYLIKAVKRA